MDCGLSEQGREPVMLGFGCSSVCYIGLVASSRNIYQFILFSRQLHLTGLVDLSGTAI